MVVVVEEIVCLSQIGANIVGFGGGGPIASRSRVCWPAGMSFSRLRAQIYRLGGVLIEPATL